MGRMMMCSVSVPDATVGVNICANAMNILGSKQRRCCSDDRSYTCLICYVLLIQSLIA